MKMSKTNYEKLTNFYNYTVENANDADVEYVLKSIARAAKDMKGQLSNKQLNKHNAKTIRDFFEDFLSKANDDEAIYLIEGLKSLVKKMIDEPEDVAKFVMTKKKEAMKNAKKEN